MYAFSAFWAQIVSDLPFALTTALTLAVILVNGWTDAPNAIATCVSTRAISVRKAIAMAAVMNFLGVLVMTCFNTAVAMTIYNMVDFGGDPKEASIALCAALAAIVIWASAAWAFGIPTSESHALIAGLSGAAIALQGGLRGINGGEWIKVLYGLVFSTLLGFGLGWLCAKGTARLFRRCERHAAEKFFSRAQIFSAAAMAFMHGAQDGQKFLGVLLLGISLSGGAQHIAAGIPIWMMTLCSLVMALGTSIGGRRIIKSVGMEMVRLDKYQGFASDLAAAASLLISSLSGIPVSTTHTKTTAIMGVGAAKRVRSVNWPVVKELVFTWILTFPGCGLIGYLTALVLLRIF